MYIYKRRKRTNRNEARTETDEPLELDTHNLNKFILEMQTKFDYYLIYLIPLPMPALSLFYKSFHYRKKKYLITR